MTILKTTIQGGQIHLHQLRMLKHIFIAGIFGALLAGSGYFMWQCQRIPTYAWQMAYETTWAKFLFVSTVDTKHEELFQVYTPKTVKPYKRSSKSILKDPVLKKATEQVERSLNRAVTKSLQFGGVVFFLIMILWFILGHLQKKPHHKRGNTLLSWKELARLLKNKGEASDLHLGKLPLLKNKETSHILMTGTTGSGKTNGFHILLPQIRQRGDRAIVLDVTGDYVSRYYNEKTDIILNPLDTRSELWHPWADCHLDSHYDVFAEAMIQPKDSSRDPFWDNASRAVLKTALRKFAAQKKMNVQELYTFLLSSTDKEFEEFFKGTEASTFAFKNNEKTTHSIRSVLSSQIEGLRQLEPTREAFSIRNWVTGDPASLLLSSGEQGNSMDSQPKQHCSEGNTLRPSAMRDGGWLFITARPDQRETLRPLISAWMDIALNALMVLPEDYTRRLWFIMDELAALQKLPCLQGGLAEIRKYGGCLLAGIQNKSQLEELYGEKSAAAMLDLFNTNIFFRCKEPATQAWISKVLGDKEETESQESISYGAHHMRDGVSLSRQARQKPLVMPTELSQLKDLECYIRLPGDTPCTKLQTSYQTPPSKKKEPFILKPEKERSYGSQSKKVKKIKKEKMI